MSAPLIGHRETLAKAIWEASRADEGTISATGANIVADALIASGAVIDADTLPNDEALVAAIAADQKEAADSWGDPLPGSELRMRARTALRALAAALSERHGDRCPSPGCERLPYVKCEQDGSLRCGEHALDGGAPDA